MKKCIVTLLVALLLLNACASVDKNPKKRFDVYDTYISQNNLISKNTIFSFKFLGWNSLDNYHLILTSSHKKTYLISLQNYCNDLTFKPQIYFDQAIDNRLSTHFDSIIVPTDLSIKCAIKSIHIINAEQKNQLLTLASDNK